MWEEYGMQNDNHVRNQLGKLIGILLGCLVMHIAVAQNAIVLSLDRTILLASDSSLAAFRASNVYLSGYWEFRNYQAERLPSLTLILTPAQYYRDITKRYKSALDFDEYR